MCFALIVLTGFTKTTRACIAARGAFTFVIIPLALGNSRIQPAIATERR